MIVISLIHFLCSLIILAEALNKLERTSLRPRSTGHVTVSMYLKAAAWFALALASGAGVATPFLPTPAPSWADMLLALGCATLIVRTRIKEEYIYGARRKQTANG